MSAYNLNSKYFVILTVVLFAISTHNAYADTSISWYWYGSPVGFVDLRHGNVHSITTIPPLTLHIEDDDPDLPDHITANIISTNTGDSVSIQLNKTSSGIFDSDSIIFIDNVNARFGIEDTITITVYDFLLANNTESNQILSGSSGLDIRSETDMNGIAVDIFEDGDTGIFKRTLHFCQTDNCSDPLTATLWVNPGDIISVRDMISGQISNGIITPTPPDKVAVAASILDDGTGLPITEFPFGSPVDDLIIASYGDANSILQLFDGTGGGGRGSGGLVRPGLVLNVIAGLGGGSVGSKNPTLGLDVFEKRIVDGGFSFNGNPVDVELFYTPYPLITTEVGKLNTIKLKIYENRGPDNIAHVGLSYGLGKGETFNEGKATIEYDRTFDGIESVTLFDPKDVLGSVNVTSSTVKCSENNNARCLEVTIDHIFRAPLEFDMVATNIWDFQRNGWQNYFNHGIHITGESMNPPEQYTGIYKGHIYHLTETGKNTAVDKNGDTWTFDKTWNRNYKKQMPIDNDVLNPDKINAIEHLGFEYSDGQKIFGFDRVDHRFEDTKHQQKIQAQSIMDSLCPDCKDESFDDIDEIFSYDIPGNSKLESETISQMKIQDKKAREFLKQYFDSIYPGIKYR